jgi:hypothetical protein
VHLGVLFVVVRSSGGGIFSAVTGFLLQNGLDFLDLDYLTCVTRSGC